VHCHYNYFTFAVSVLLFLLNLKKEKRTHSVTGVLDSILVAAVGFSTASLRVETL
jgi:hypothetical protein